MTAPTFLGPYRIGDLIGRGGMGNVYAAQHEATGEAVAVKLIAAHVADEPRFRRRFEKEIHALKLLSHPGIVRLIGYGEEGGQLFYSMELVRGETLQTLLRRMKRIDCGQAIDFGIQICAALKHAHDIGVQHRDLKPANLMLTDAGKIKLVDFGIPKNFWDSSGDTAVGVVLGTPDYMAPEQADGGPISERTDLYSLGSVMYAMLTGRSPFKGKNASAVIQSLKHERPVPLQVLAEDTPDDLAELIQHLLQKDPADRPATAWSVSNRLKVIQAGLDASATSVQHATGTQYVELPSSLETLPSSADPKNPNQATDSDRATHVNHATGGPSQRSPLTLVSRNDQTLTGDPSAVLSHDSKTLDSRDSNETPTIDSVAGGQSGFTTRPDPARTRFHVVKPEDRPLAGETPPTTASMVQGSLTVAATVAVLAVLGWATLTALSPPSANQLYEKAIADQDLDAANAFISRHADDPRTPQLQDMVSRQQVRTVLNRIRAQQAIGLKPLTAAEEGFLAAMDMRQSDPDLARTKLQQWLDVFDDQASQNDRDVTDEDAPGDHKSEMRESLASLIQSAREELTRLDKPRVSQADPRLNELMLQIDSSIDRGDTTQTTRKLTALKETFSGIPWAQPAIERANQWLTKQTAPRKIE